MTEDYEHELKALRARLAERPDPTKCSACKGVGTLPAVVVRTSSKIVGESKRRDTCAVCGGTGGAPRYQTLLDHFHRTMMALRCPTCGASPGVILPNREPDQWLTGVNAPYVVRFKRVCGCPVAP